MSLVSTARAREHVLHLQAAGLGTRAIADLARVSRSTVKWVLRNDTMTSAVEAVLLAVRPEVLGPKNLTDGTGTHRRIKGLVALGWSTEAQAKLVGRCPRPYRASLRSASVLRSTADQVRVIYDKLSMSVVEVPQANWVKMHARRRRYFPPLAWDEETIDDPEALPCLLPPVAPVDRDLELLVQHLAAGHDVTPTPAAIREVVRRMPDAKNSEIAQLVRCAPKQVGDARQRLKVVGLC